MRQILILPMVCISFLGMTSTARAFNFEGAPTMTVPSKVSPVSKWSLGITEKGDTFSEYCGLFLAQMNLLAVISQPTCWNIIGSLNGLTSKYELDHLALGQLVWLPDLSNSPTEIVKLFHMRSVTADFSVYPLGRPSVIHYYLMGEDDISRFLLKDETEILSKAEVKAIAEQVVRDNHVVTPVQLEEALRVLHAELDTKSTSAGLSRYEVTQLIAEALKTAYVSDEVTIDTMQNAQRALTTRVRALEEAMKTKADSARVDALDDKLTNATNKAPSTKEGEGNGFAKFLPYLLGFLALMIALFALIRSWANPSKTNLRQVDEKVTKSTADAGQAVAKASAAEASAGRSMTAAESSAAAAAAVSARALGQVDGLTGRVAVLEAGYETTSRLADNLFEDVHGLHPLQQFPTEAAINALEVGQTMVLIFGDDEGKRYTLRLTKEEDGRLILQGLYGRTAVPLANPTSVLKTIRKAFQKAQQEGSVTLAFQGARTSVRSKKAAAT